MFSLEEVDQFLKGDISFDEESVPDRPFDIVVLFVEGSLEAVLEGGERVRGRTLFLAIAMGSEKPKNGSARLTNPFLYCSISVFPSIIYSTQPISPLPITTARERAEKTDLVKLQTNQSSS